MTSCCKFSIRWSPIRPCSTIRGRITGAQYRTAIVPLSAEQRAVASAYLAQMRRSPCGTIRLSPGSKSRCGSIRRRITTRISSSTTLDNPYIRRWDAPKLVALREKFPALYRAHLSHGLIAPARACAYRCVMAAHHHHEHHGEPLLDEARRVLTDAGEQWTAMRADVYRTLAAQDRPASAYDIAECGRAGARQTGGGQQRLPHS